MTFQGHQPNPVLFEGVAGPGTLITSIGPNPPIGGIYISADFEDATIGKYGAGATYDVWEYLYYYFWNDSNVTIDGGTKNAPLADFNALKKLHLPNAYAVAPSGNTHYWIMNPAAVMGSNMAEFDPFGE